MMPVYCGGSCCPSYYCVYNVQGKAQEQRRCGRNVQVIGYVTSETTFLLGERLDLYLGLGLGLGLVRPQLESEI